MQYRCLRGGAEIACSGMARAQQLSRAVSVPAASKKRYVLGARGTSYACGGLAQGGKPKGVGYEYDPTKISGTTQEHALGFASRCVRGT